MGKSKPKAPDPNQVAAEENQWGLKSQYQNTAFNQMSQNTPWGSLNYSGDLPTFDDQGNMLTEGDRAANVTLSPSQQQAFNQNNQINRTLRGYAQDSLIPQIMGGSGQQQQQQQQRPSVGGTGKGGNSDNDPRRSPSIGSGRIGDRVGNKQYRPAPGDDYNSLPGFERPDYSKLADFENPDYSKLADFEQPNYGGLPGLPGNENLGGWAQELEDATYQRGINQLQPGFDQRQKELSNRLVNQGLPEGSEAHTNALEEMRSSQGRQRENLALSSVAAGRQEQSRLYDIGSRRRGQLFGEQTTRRGQTAAERGQQFNEFTTQRGQTAAERGQQFNEFTTQRGQQAGERGQVFGEQTTRRNQSAAEQAQAFRQQMQSRQQLFGELADVLGRSTNIQSPQFQNQVQSGIGAPNVSGTYNNNYNQASNQYNNQQSGMYNAMGSLGLNVHG